MDTQKEWKNLESDQELENRIRCFLASRNVPRLRNLDVVVEDGFAFIRGHVDSFYEKQLATHCCQRVAGVLRVYNEVEVRMPHLEIEHDHQHSTWSARKSPESRSPRNQYSVMSFF